MTIRLASCDEDRKLEELEDNDDDDDDDEEDKC